MAKINLTKEHVKQLEAVSKSLKTRKKFAKGEERKALTVQIGAIEDVLIRHENRQEKDY